MKFLAIKALGVRRREKLRISHLERERAQKRKMSRVLDDPPGSPGSDGCRQTYARVSAAPAPRGRPSARRDDRLSHASPTASARNASGDVAAGSCTGSPKGAPCLR